MAQLITKKEGDSLWLLNKSRYPGIKDIHIHQHNDGLTLTVVTVQGYKEHLDVDKYATVERFGELLNYVYHKLQQQGKL